jgi:hypothetical protein
MARRSPTVAIELPPAPPRAEAPPEDPPPPPPPRELVDLGDPPTDILGLRAYTARAYAVMLRAAMLDPSLSPDARAKAVGRWGRSIEGLKADVEIWEALRLLRRDRDEIDQPARGAPVEATPAAVADPGAARPKRARPPKRAG